MKLQNQAENAYVGWDDGANRPLLASPGDIVEVSEVKAEQLMADFPDDWTVAPEDAVVSPVTLAAAKSLDVEMGETEDAAPAEEPAPKTPKKGGKK